MSTHLTIKRSTAEENEKPMRTMAIEPSADRAVIAARGQLSNFGHRRPIRRLAGSPLSHLPPTFRFGWTSSVRSIWVQKGGG